MSTPDKRMFERDGKFWEVWQKESTVFTRFGATGANGQTRLKKEPSPDLAKKLLEKMVKEKVHEGFRQTGGDLVTDSSVKPLDPKALKKHLASLTDDAAHLVFADWLTEQGHPWGELITLQHGAATATTDKKREQLEKSVAKLVKEHGTTLLGRTAQQKYARFTWHLGMLERATIESAPDAKAILAAVKELLAQPAAQKLRGVSVAAIPITFQTVRDWGATDENLVNPWPDPTALAAALPDRITHVGFGGWPAPPAAAYVEWPNLGKVSKAFPKLEGLSITGWHPDNVGKLSIPTLKELSVRFSNATEAGLATLAGSKLPKLERLTVWLGANASCILDDVYEPEDYDEDDEDALRYPATFKGTDLEQLEVYSLDSDVGARAIQTLLNALPKTVKHLALQGGKMDDEMLQAIVTHKAIKQLETLDLSGGNLNDDSVNKVLVKQKKTLEHLASLDLSDNRLSDAGVKRVKSTLPNARADRQRKKDPEFFMRFVATME